MSSDFLGCCSTGVVAFGAASTCKELSPRVNPQGTRTKLKKACCTRGRCIAAPIQCSLPGIAETRTSASEIEAKISVARSTGALDLSDCGLDELPREIFSIEDLTDLSLAGNNISHLPPEIAKLRKLRRLGLAGNKLREIPEEIGECTSVRGLWVHGNLLTSIPKEVGRLSSLEFLALAGNQLKHLPDTVCQLDSLQVLSVAGNELAALPLNLGSLNSLRILAAHGNFLEELPPTLPLLTSLQDLWLQGNSLTTLPSCLASLPDLKQLSLADNKIKHEEPDALLNLPSLQVLWLYGNRLDFIPEGLKWGFASAPKLTHLWLEGNPLDPESLRGFLQGSARLMKSVGIDRSQLSAYGSMYVESLPANMRVGESVGSAGQQGYFKLQPWLRTQKADTLVVAFGSAPGVPNWGGLLKKVKGNAPSAQLPTSADGTPAELPACPPFDTLFVVDPARCWYTDREVSDPSTDVSADAYRTKIREATAGYRHVVMLGDSMGASAALLFSEFADQVVAFCPQVDLGTASIRPGRPSEWLVSFRNMLLTSLQHRNGVNRTNGPSFEDGARRKRQIWVHCGNWSHDLTQARFLESSPNVKLFVHDVDDHRLAKELDSRGQLQALVCRAILG